MSLASRVEPIRARSAENIDGSRIADIRLQVVRGSWATERAHLPGESPHLFQEGKVSPVISRPAEPAELKSVRFRSAPDHAGLLPTIAGGRTRERPPARTSRTVATMKTVAHSCSVATTPPSLTEELRQGLILPVEG